MLLIQSCLIMVEGSDTSLSKVKAGVVCMEHRRSVGLKEPGAASPVSEIVVGLKANNKIFYSFRWN